MNYNHIQSDGLDGDYVNHAIEEFDLITVENFCKPHQIIKSTNDTLEGMYFDYDNCLWMQEWASNNSMAFRGHALSWYNNHSYPYWYKQVDNSTELQDMFIDYITESML
jgi:GH35 family endo-1,4-beta-xylanase